MAEESAEVIFARMETKLDILLTERQDHEVRIRTLEKLAWSIPASVLTAISSLVVVLLKK